MEMGEGGGLGLGRKVEVGGLVREMELAEGWGGVEVSEEGRGRMGFVCRMVNLPWIRIWPVAIRGSMSFSL